MSPFELDNSKLEGESLHAGFELRVTGTNTTQKHLSINLSDIVVHVLRKMAPPSLAHGYIWDSFRENLPSFNFMMA